MDKPKKSNIIRTLGTAVVTGGVASVLGAAWPAVAVAGVFGGIIGKLFLSSEFLEKIKNKKLVVLGRPVSGKTTLTEYLCTYKLLLPSEVEATICTSEEKKTLNDLGVKIKTVRDCRSRKDIDEYSYKEEKSLVRECDVIFYLFKISQLFMESKEDEYFEKIEDEIKLYNLRSGENDKKVFIALGTFGDEVSKENLNITDDEIIRRKARILTKIKKLLGNFKCKWGIIVGCSFVNKIRAEKTVGLLMKALDSIYKGKPFAQWDVDEPV